MAKDKLCVDCGKGISARATRCLSCSASHNNRKRAGPRSHLWKGGLVKTLCEWCKSEFEVKPSWLKRGEGKFCSQKCKGNAHSVSMRGANNPKWVEKVPRVCAWCSVEFEAYPSLVKAGFAKFCSSRCHADWASENRRGKNAHSWQGRTLARYCESCGKEFKAPACVVEDGKGRFCSRDCYGVYFSGERRPQWLGGISFEPYPPEFNERYKRMVRERDDNCCTLCGKTEQENGERLSVHHVDYDKDNLDPNLKATLCASCHGKTNSNRQFWTTVFTRYWRRASVQDWQVRKVVL